MAKALSARNVISGTHGYLWINDDICYEVSSFEVKLKINGETITFAGEMMEDRKLMGLSGTWSVKVKKVYSRSRDIAEELLEGKDPRMSLTGKLADPDSFGTEMIKITNCWLDELTIQQFEHGKIAEDELSGGWTGLQYLDSISA